MLRQRLEHVGCETRHVNGDADVLIVETTVQSTMYCETILVGDDKSLLVLLCFHVKEESCEVFFIPEIGYGTQNSPRCWNIKNVQRVLQADILLQDNVKLADISSEGEAALVCMFTGAVGGTLGKLSLQRFHQKVATSKRFV